MKLYDGGRAPNPRRVTVFLAEKGIDIERVPVDMGNLGHKSEEVTGLNPLQRLPVLVLDDGTALSESVAICRYLEELYPEPPLLGVDARDRAIVEMWNRRVELHFLASVAAAFRHTHPAMKEWEVPQVAEWGEANRPKALAFLELLDKELATREFIAGDRYTIADITAMIAVDFMKPARIDKPEHLENLMRWYQAVSSRPSAQAV
ncbi:Glutathione S-transferase [Hoeflea phototrophica DFL-43]|jgi:glutathione S-transferase|uniref:Glutathione S-transferase n=1 Tax=Hoeflea phototrophica (strain DSM 17068 / NCIMB 14078 / DFL-43) TaxID=411684 RepID=A9D6U5_HOEPD|nr:glutathione S-transferase [Hoeflea phototrophica]EDQ33598.1 Glutathione S-transferase [Hoeflea phototrophica DFL-43]